MENKASLNPAFNKFAGKIVNMAEVNNLQYSAGFAGFTERLRDGFKSAVELVKIPFLPHSPSSEYKDLPQVYVTAGKSEFEPQKGRDVYFEVSTALSFMDASLGKSALLPSFLSAIERAPDHVDKLAADKLKLADKYSFTATTVRIGFTA